MAFLALVSAAPLHGEPHGKHLFILSGQSNMGGLKPETSFIPTVKKAFGADHVIVIKDAQGGQPIARWYKQWAPAKGEPPEKRGDLYDRLMTKVKAAIEGQRIETVSFCWMQGERDAKTGHANVYETSLKGLLQQLRTDLKRDDLNFVIGRLSDHLMNNEGWVNVRKIQASVADQDPRGAWVDTDDLNDKKRKNGTIKQDLHYTREGYTLLGTRFAENAIALIKKKD